jgi:hypothetical protein
MSIFHTVLNYTSKTAKRLLIAGGLTAAAATAANAGCSVDGTVNGQRYTIDFAIPTVGAFNAIVSRHGITDEQTGRTARLSRGQYPSEQVIADVCLAKAGDYHFPGQGIFNPTAFRGATWNTRSGGVRDYREGPGCVDQTTVRQRGPAAPSAC